MTLISTDCKQNVMYPSPRIPTFNDLEKEAFGKHCGKRRKCWLPAFCTFPTIFSTCSQKSFNFSVIHVFILLPANALDLNQSKKCCLVKS